MNYYKERAGTRNPSWTLPSLPQCRTLYVPWLRQMMYVVEWYLYHVVTN